MTCITAGIEWSRVREYWIGFITTIDLRKITAEIPSHFRYRALEIKLSQYCHLGRSHQ